jgi:hypothetical protein
VEERIECFARRHAGGAGSSSADGFERARRTEKKKERNASMTHVVAAEQGAAAD